MRVLIKWFKSMYKYTQQNAMFGGSFMNEAIEHRRKNEKPLRKANIFQPIRFYYSTVSNNKFENK